MEPAALDDRPRSRRAGALAAGLLALVALVVGAVAWAMAGGSDDRALVAIEPGLADAAGATRAERSARVELVSVRDGETDTFTGVMSFGSGGRGLFAVSEDADSEGDIRALPDATYVFLDGGWTKFSNEDFTLDNGLRFADDQNPLLGIIEVLLDALDHAAPESVTETGTDVHHGDPVRVMSAEVDLLAAIEERAEVVDAVAAGGLFAAIGPEIVVWVDDRGRARRVVLDNDDERLEVSIWDFDVEVAVDAPADAIDDEDVVTEDDRRSAEARPSLDGLDPVEEFCARVEYPEVSSAFADPEDRRADWIAQHDVTRRVAELVSDGLPPDAAVDELGDDLSFLADRYLVVGLEVARGTAVAQMVEDGVRIGGESISWERLARLELEVLRSLEELAYDVGCFDG